MEFVSIDENSKKHYKHTFQITITINKNSNEYSNMIYCMNKLNITAYSRYARRALLRMIESDMQEIQKQAQTGKNGNTDT